MAIEDGVVFSFPYNTGFSNQLGAANDIIPSGIIIDPVNPAIGAGSAFGNGAVDGVIPFSSALDVSSMSLAIVFRHTTAGTTILMERSEGVPTENGSWSVLTVSGKIRFFLRLGGVFQIVDSTSIVNDNNNHLLLASFDGSQIRLGIDNILEATVNYSGSIPATGRDINVFARTGKIIPYPGNEDSSIMWNRPISDGGLSIGQPFTGEKAEVWNNGNFIELFQAIAAGRRRRTLLRSN